MPNRHLQRVVGIFVGMSLSSIALLAQTALPERIQAVMSRPEFAHAHFGIEFCSLDTGERLFALNEKKLFVPGSTTKLLTEGAALELLGPNYRFHTPVYRTGEIDASGVLHGDVVLVASADPNLSGRIQPDDTLGFEDEDHSYGGPDAKGLAGDPLLVLGQIADQIATKGIHRIRGRVLVDATLFPEGSRELGTGVVISPVVLNDNVVDVLASPGATEGSAVKLQIRPETGYLKFVNRATTGKTGSKADIAYDDGDLRPDGTRTVIVNGTLPLGKPTALYAYAVAEPSRFAASALTDMLRKRGIEIVQTDLNHNDPQHAGPLTATKSVPASYDADHLLAEHISPPLSEEVKVTLKVSQNLHASMTPFTLGRGLSPCDEGLSTKPVLTGNAPFSKARVSI